MKKKLFIGSIIAVVILILVSFTGVVGYQTTKSSTIARASPLFNIRTNRAIDRESKDIACDYAGKENTLPFPERNDKAILTQKVIDSIRRIDDKTFEKFISIIIFSAQKDGRIKGTNTDKIKEAFNQFRNSDKSIPIYGDDTKQMPTLAGQCPSIQFCPTFDSGIEGFLYCIMLLILSPLAVLFTVYVIINMISRGVNPTLFICPSMILQC